MAISHVFPGAAPACTATQSRVSSASRCVRAVCRTCRSFCESGLSRIFHTLVRRHRSGLSNRCQALPSFCTKNHLLGTNDVVRGQRWNHCAQDFPSPPLAQQFQGVSFGPNLGNQASQQRPCSGSAQASPLANVSSWFVTARHMKNAMQTRLFKRTNLK